MKEFPLRLRNLRDKNGSHRRSKSVPAQPKEAKNRPLSAEAFRAMFRLDGLSSRASKQEAEITAAKVQETQQHLERLGLRKVSDGHLRGVLASKFAGGDPVRAAEFVDLQQKAEAGIIISHDPGITLVGAENRDAVTCYLDALLFAMFSKLDAFECMLRHDFPRDDPRSNLVNQLRVWVNMLRSGKLIHADQTKLIQDALADCGWPDARRVEQQDASEAFVFLTETLQLPLLSLQVDLFHQGMREENDRKVVFERLLNLAVPSDPEGKGVKLEDCLEDYFNARVDVLRESEEATKSATHHTTSEVQPALSPGNNTSVRLNNGGEAEASSSATASPAKQMHQTTSLLEVGSSPKTNPQSHNAPETQEGTSEHIERLDSQSQPSPALEKSTSVIRRLVVDDRGHPAEDASDVRRARKKGSSVIKAVTIPAWQFFRLIPWQTLSSNEPRNDTEVAMNLDQRPIVGICLKRYAIDESGRPQRINTFIDIPDSLRLPHFMFANDSTPHQDNGLSADYKLVLQSVVCHRGGSVQTGHYIAFARVAPKLLKDNRRHDFDPPPDYEQAQWVRFDDLEAENRVVFVDGIKESLKKEMPYMLFYQIVPMVDMYCPSTKAGAAEPPCYANSRKSSEAASFASQAESRSNERGRQSTVYPDEMLSGNAQNRSKPPSIRLSSENEGPSRPIFDKNWSGWGARSTPAGSGRLSLVCMDSEAVTPAATPDANSPVVGPSEEPPTSRLSRAASRFALGKQSRSASQSGESRLSFSMTRLGGLMKGSKEPLADASSSVINDAAGPSGASMTSKAPSEVPADGDKSAGPAQVNPAKQGRGKSKGKEKTASSQPERECSIM